MVRWFTVFFLLILAGCAGSITENREETLAMAVSLVPQMDSPAFRKVLAEYLEKKGHKAFAVDLKTLRWGRTWNYKWIADAKTNALQRAGPDGRLLLVNSSVQSGNFFSAGKDSVAATPLAGLQSAVVTPATTDLPKSPLLDFDTGMHTAMINRLGVASSGDFLLTPSDDRTVRLWNLRTGVLLHTFYLPFGSNADGGMVQAAAVAPDGRHAAISVVRGSWEDSHSIYFLDLAEKKVLKKVVGLPEVALNLDYSDDGNYLAASLNGRAGLRVYRLADYSLALLDEDYAERSMGVDFSSSGWLATASRDGYVRLYDEELRLHNKRRILHEATSSPYQLRFSPDGQRIAMGMENSIKVEVLRTADLTTLALPAPFPDHQPQEVESLFAVSWSNNGDYLYAGGRLQEKDSSGNWLHHIYRWPAGSLEQVPDKFVAGNGSVLSILPLGADGIVWGASDPSWGTIQGDGQAGFGASSPLIDARANRSRILLSPDGTTIGYYSKVGEPVPHLFSLDVREGTPLQPQLETPVMASARLAVTNWNHSRTPSINGQLLTDLVGETRCYALTIAGDFAVLGTDQRLYGIDDSGRIRWQQARNGETWALNIAAKANLFVAGYSDGTIRWHDLLDGTELLAFFPHADGKRWIAWTPEGFFDHSPGGEELIGYRLNGGPEDLARFVNVSQLYQHYFRPDLVRKRLYPGFREEIQRELTSIGEVRKLLEEGLPPEVAIVAPTDETTSPLTSANVYIRMRETGGGASRLVVRVNGIPMVETSVVLLKGSGQEKTISRQIQLEPGENLVQAIAYNAFAKIESKPAAINLHTPMKTTGPGKLYVLAVGLNKYTNPKLNLSYAVSDSEAVSVALQQFVSGMEFTGVNVTRLVDDDATKDNIVRAFSELRGNLDEDDLLVFYAAAHGVTIGGRFYILPYDVSDLSSIEAVSQAGIATDELQELLTVLPARKIVIILDTCYAEGFAKDIYRYLSREAALGRLVRNTGRAILCSSSEEQQALEGHAGHGLFTYVLLEALRGEADARGNGDQYLTIEETANYVVQEVPRLAQELWQFEQTPTFSHFGKDFRIGRLSK